MKTKRPTFLRGQAGYTLIEAIMAMLFLGIAFTAILRAMSAGVSQSFDAEMLTRATALAEERMEQVVGDKTSRGYDYLVNANYPVETNAGGYKGFTRSVSISANASSKSIVVVVAHAGIPSVRLTSFVANY